LEKVADVLQMTLLFANSHIGLEKVADVLQMTLLYANSHIGLEWMGNEWVE
jgi:hypothetical protein